MWSRRSRQLVWDPVVFFGKSVHQGQETAAWPTTVLFCSRRRRWLTTTTPTQQHQQENNMIATTQKKKRKKRSKSLFSLNKTPTTTRDRVRWLQDNNAVLTDNYYVMKSRHRAMEDWGTTAEERLTFLRDKIYSFWRSSSSSSSNNQSALLAGRPKKPTLQMDSKWWFWNILFALFPAFLVACYCEFIGKPDVMEYQRIMHIAAQKDLLGDNYNQEEDEQLKAILQDSETFVTKAYDAIRDLTMYFWGQLVPPVDNKLSIPPMTTTNKEPTYSASTTTSTRSVADNTVVRASSVLSPQDSEDAATIDELKRKLEELELRFKARQVSDSKDTAQPTAPPPKQHSRIHTRIIHQRRQEALEIAAKNEMAKTSAAATVPTPTTTTTSVIVEETKQPSIWERLNMVANTILGTEEESGSSNSPPQPLPQLESPAVTNTKPALLGESTMKAEPPTQRSTAESNSHATVTNEVVAVTRDPQTRQAPAPKTLAPKPQENGPTKAEHEDDASRKSIWWTNLWRRP
jgi:hypothetical protein